MSDTRTSSSGLAYIPMDFTGYTPMSEEQQRARSWRFNPDARVEVIVLSPTRAAMFVSGVSTEIWIGEIADLPAALAARPAHIPRPARPSRSDLTASLLSSLDIEI